MNRVLIKNFSLPQLEAWVGNLDERPFRARQLFRQLYVRHVTSWDECSDLSKSFRNRLESGALLNALELADKRQDSDGTTKYLFVLQDGLHIEAVLIPDPPRHTLCLSSQVGCALGCRFCRTGALGFQRNLQTAEIVDQVCRVQSDLAPEVRISNLVFMGMGEPLANYNAVVRALGNLISEEGMNFSHRTVTLSTCGLVPQIRRLGRQVRVNLAVSLNASDDETRSFLMPVNRKYSLKTLVEALKEFPILNRRMITFEYVLVGGINDRDEDAHRVATLLKGTRAKVNLIALNPHPDVDLSPPSPERALRFQEILIGHHLTAILRKSKGQDISAACGQLSGASGQSSVVRGKL